MAHFPEFRVNENPRQLLIEFLMGLQQLLNEVLENGSGPTGLPLFVPDLFPLVREAWIHGREQIPAFMESVRTISSQRIAEHQLEGPPLQAKLGIIRYYSGQFINFGTSAVLERLFSAINSLLKSLADAAGAGGFLGELKELAENAIR
jgi:hypothetical protein